MHIIHYILSLIIIEVILSIVFISYYIYNFQVLLFICLFTCYKKKNIWLEEKKIDRKDDAKNQEDYPLML